MGGKHRRAQNPNKHFKKYKARHHQHRFETITKLNGREMEMCIQSRCKEKHYVDNKT